MFAVALRSKLAEAFSACILARRCKPDCDHAAKSVSFEEAVGTEYCGTYLSIPSTAESMICYLNLASYLKLIIVTSILCNALTLWLGDGEAVSGM